MTIIMRNSFVLRNRRIPNELAWIEIPHRGAPERIVTWADVLKARRERQARLLREIRGEYRAPAKRALKVEVWHNPFFPYAGWHCYLFGVAGWRQWVKETDNENPLGLQTLFPMSLLPVSFYEWKRLFAKEHEVGRRGGEPRGIAYVWGSFSGDRLDRIEGIAKERTMKRE